MRGQPSEEPVSGQETGIEWSQMLAATRENWSPAQIVREKKGRPPKRSWSSRWRTDQQRAFAAGVLHSVRLYDGLRAYDSEIRAMLCARGLVDEQKAKERSAGQKKDGLVVTESDPLPVARGFDSGFLG